MNREEVTAKMIEFAAMAFGKDAANIKEDTNIAEELGVSSSQRVAMSASIVGIGATPFFNGVKNPTYKGLTNGELFGHAALAVYDRLYPYYIGMYRHLDEDLKGLKHTLEL